MVDGSIKIDVALDKTKFLQEITGLSEKAKPGMDKLRDAIQATTKSIDELEDKKADLTMKSAELATKLEVLGQVMIDGEVTSGALADEWNSMYKELEKLDDEIAAVTKTLEAQEEVLATQTSEWVAFRTQMTDVSKSLADASETLKTVGGNLMSVGTKLSIGITAPLVLLGKQVIQAGIDFESAFAGVRRTVDGSAEDFEMLEKSIREMALEIPVAATEIAKMAEVAGQMGIETPNIMGFTRAMLDLGVTTTMNANEAAMALSKFANITGMAQTDFDRLGSTVTHLGTNFAATETQIVNMAMRLAGAGAQIGLSEAEIMGVAAALSSVGINAEMGGSAISRVMVRMQAATAGFRDLDKILDVTGLSFRELQMMMENNSREFTNLADSMGMTRGELSRIVRTGADLENFAKIAGMTAEEFRKAFAEDAVGALQAFIQGLGDAEDAGESAIMMLQEMGVTEIRLRDALLRMAGASDMLTSAVQLSTQAWDENEALQREAARRYETTASQIQILRNTLNELFIQLAAHVLPILNTLIGRLAEGIKSFFDMDESTKQWLWTLGSVLAAIGPVLLGLGTLLTILGSVVGALSTFTGTLGVMGTGLLTGNAKIDAMSKVFGLLLNPITLTVAAVALFSYALANLTPIGNAAYAMLIALVAGIVAFQAVAIAQGVILGLSAAFMGLAGALTAAELAQKGVNVGLIAGKTIMGLKTIAVGAYNAVLGIAKTVIAGVTTGQWAWNAALTANPIGAVIALVAGLAAGIAFLVWNMNKQSEEVRNLRAETDLLREAQEALLNRLGQSAQRFQENLQGMHDEQDIIRDLANDVIRLSQLENKSAEDKALLAVRVAELNRLVPELGLAYNAEADALNMSSAAILHNIDNRRRQLELERLLNREFELKANQAELWRAITSALEDSTAAWDAHAAAIARGDRPADVAKLAAIAHERMAIEQELQDAYNANIITLAELEEQITQTAVAYANSANSLTNMEDSLSGIEVAALAASQALEQHQRDVEQFGKDAAAAFDFYYNAATNALRKINVQEQTNADGTAKTQQQIRDEFTETIRHNTEIVRSWASNLQKLNEMGLDPKFLDDLRAAGPESAALVAALVEASAAEIEELNDALAEGARVALQAMHAEFGMPEHAIMGADLIKAIAENVENEEAFVNAVLAMLDEVDASMIQWAQQSGEITNVGDEIVASVVTSIDKGRPRVLQAGIALANELVAGTRRALDMHSPSRVMMSVGEESVDSLVMGGYNKISIVGVLGQDIAEAYTNGLTTSLDEGMQSVGENMALSWQRSHRELVEISRVSGADLIHAELETLRAIIAETERANRERTRLNELASRERAVAEARDAEARVRAQEQLNELLARHELEALRERQRMLEDQLREIERAYNDMSRAITDALRIHYREQADMARQAARDEYDFSTGYIKLITENRRNELERQIQDQRDATSAIIDQFRREYDAQLTTLGIEESEAVAALRSQIDAIDRITEAEDRALREQANQRRLADLQRRIAEAQNEEDRLRAQEAFNAEVEKQARDSLLQQRRDEKASLQEQIRMVQQSYREQRDLARQEMEWKQANAREEERFQLDILNRQLQDNQQYYENTMRQLDQHLREREHVITQHYDSLMTREALEAEARRMIIQNDQEAIIALLNRYVPDWAMAGQSAGQAFLNALQGITPHIEGEVARIMQLINQASTAQANMQQAAPPPGSHQPQPWEGIGLPPGLMPPQQPQQQQQTYTVKSGDTLWAIASMFNTTVDKLRQLNGLRPEDDRRLPIGLVLRIPVMHDGGISMREQLILADKHEAVLPLAELARMMEKAVITTANMMVMAFRGNRSTSLNTTNNNDHGVKVDIHKVEIHGSDVNRRDAWRFGQELGEEAAREIRSRGVPVLT